MGGPSPLWVPSRRDIESANLTAFARERGLDSYRDLWRWSVTHRADFWSAVAGRLGVRFREASAIVLDDSRGAAHARWWPGASLNIVDSCFQHDPNKVALVHRRHGELFTVTYGQLETQVNTAAAHFTPDESIGIASPMTLETVVAYLAVVKAGGTVVSIAESFSPPEIRRRLSIGGAATVITQDMMVRSGRRLPMLEKVIDAGASKAIVVRTAEGRAVEVREPNVEWTDVLEQERGAVMTVPGPPDHHITVLFSSGTTGDPKAIPWTHLTPIKSAMDGHFHLDLGPEDVVCWPTSLGWMMGPWLIFATLINGCSMALFDDAPTGRPFGEFVRDAGVTMLGVVPSVISRWRESGCMEGLEWGNVRRFASTGEASNAEDMRYVSRLAGGKPVIEYCGGTEIGGGYITGTMVEPSFPSLFSTPALGLDIVIVGKDDEPADEGEVFLVPPSVGLSTELTNGDHHAVYYAGVPRAGLRRHGDYMVRLANGRYRALGRADDTMNLGGIKVSSAELEHAVLSLPEVSEVAAVSSADTLGGRERLTLFLVPRTSVTVDGAEWQRMTQAAISATLNPLFKVHEVIVVESLPRTASNKVMRRALKARIRTQREEREAE